MDSLWPFVQRKVGQIFPGECVQQRYSLNAQA